VTARSGKNPLNFSTTIEADKTASECVSMLARHGAGAVSIAFDAGKPTGLSFTIGTQWGPRQYSLPVNIDGTQKALLAAYRKGTISRRFSERDQAERVGWRVIKDWLESQLALIEAGLLNLPQVMLPYVQGDDGRTMWEVYSGTQQALEAGDR
jgi:hypothetical protein